jgi:tRNA (guanosine-2'-O-)-methyltransferase
MAYFLFPPQLAEFAIDDSWAPTSRVWDILKNYLTDSRRKKIESVTSSRCFSILPILEGLYDQGNVSAVLRTAEGLGFGGAVIVQTQEKFKVSQRTSAGADKWLLTKKYSDPTIAVNELKEHGYRVIATSLHPQAQGMEHFQWNEPTAIIFGNEKEGVSQATLKMADAHLYIPMRGFVQSFNISVAAAIVLSHISTWRAQQLNSFADLTPEQILYLNALFACRTLDSHSDILRRELGSKSH